MDFSQRTGFGQSYISQILSGSKTNPSPRFYATVCREFNVNPEWLKTGKGEMYAALDGESETENAELMAKYKQLPKHEQKIIEDLVNVLLMKDMSKEQAIEKKEKRTKKK